jgi:branched-chain amino acid transport system substrate-binding protein
MKRLFRCLGLVFTGISVILFSIPLSFAAEPIKVGIVLPLTGEKATFGEIERNSFLMALSDINKAGGVKGAEIKLLIEDDTGNPDVARAATEKLISKDNVVMLGGGYGSSETYAIAGVAQQKKMPFLINTGAADKITEQGWNYIQRPRKPFLRRWPSQRRLLFFLKIPSLEPVAQKNLKNRVRNWGSR